MKNIWVCIEMCDKSTSESWASSSIRFVTTWYNFKVRMGTIYDGFHIETISNCWHIDIIGSLYYGSNRLFTWEASWVIWLWDC